MDGAGLSSRHEAPWKANTDVSSRMWGWTLLYALIHRSAWNRNSANFAITGFSEVHPQE